MKQSLPLTDLLYEALAAEFGIIIETSNPAALKAKLYSLRKEDEDFLRLSFLTSRTSPVTQIWIVKKPKEADDGENPDS